MVGWGWLASSGGLRLVGGQGWAGAGWQAVVGWGWLAGSGGLGLVGGQWWAGAVVGGQWWAGAVVGWQGASSELVRGSCAMGAGRAVQSS